MRDDSESTAVTATEEQKRVKEFKALEKAKIDELRTITPNKVFLRFILQILDKCHQNGISFHPSEPLRTAFLEGERNIGNFISDLISSADEDSYDLLMKALRKGKKDG